MASLFRFSVRTLLVIVTAGCVGIAAMLNADAWWEAAAWGFVLFLLSSAVLLVVYRRDQQRAFWLGFVVFGGAYLALLLYSFTTVWKQEAYASNPLHFNSLATTKLMGYVYGQVIPDSRRQEYVSVPADESAVPMYSGGGDATIRVSRLVDFGATTNQWTTSRTMTPNPSYVQPGKFISIGHTLWLLVIAVVGGKVCQFIHATRPPG